MGGFTLETSLGSVDAQKVVVATGSFADRPSVIVFLAAAGLIAMIMMMPIAGWFGKRAAKRGALAPAGTKVVDADVRRT